MSNKKKEHESHKSTEYISIRAIRAIRVLLTPLKQQSPHDSFVLFEILLPVSQWVYDKSRVPLTTQAAESTDLIRAIRDIRVPLTTQAAEPTDLIRAIRVPLTTQAAEPS